MSLETRSKTDIRSIAALEFREWLGGERKINAYCHDLALDGGRKLAELLGTSVLDQDGEFTANMVRSPFSTIVSTRSPYSR